MPKPRSVPGLGPRVRLSEAAERLLNARLADVRRYERGLAGPMKVDDVHDMRVATRRLRAALKLCSVPKSLDRKVKRFQDSLGAVRDIHVQVAWLEETAKTSDDEVQRIIAIVSAYLKRQLPARVEALKEELRRWTTRTVPAIRAAPAAIDEPHRLGSRHFRDALREHIGHVGDEMKSVIASPDAHEAHVLRIEVKKLRYMAELLKPAWPDKIAVLLGMLQPLQEALGDLHDADVRVQQLTNLATVLPQSGAGVQHLLKHVKQEREALADKAVGLAMRWRRERVVQGMRRLLSGRTTS